MKRTESMGQRDMSTWDRYELNQPTSPGHELHHLQLSLTDSADTVETKRLDAELLERSLRRVLPGVVLVDEKK